MRFLGRVVKYVLRSFFSIIVFLLFVWWSKMNRDANSYVTFLNDHDWLSFQWSQPATWTDPFWPNENTSDTISDMFTWDQIDSEMSGLDVFDPAFEEDFNDATAWSLSGAEEDFWFTTDEQKNTNAQTWSETTSKSELLNLIKQRELTK